MREPKSTQNIVCLHRGGMPLKVKTCEMITYPIDERIYRIDTSIAFTRMIGDKNRTILYGKSMCSDVCESRLV